MNLVRKALISGLFTGYLPAPGTWGSLAAALVFVAACYACGGDPVVTAIVAAVVAIASSVACVALGKSAEQIYGRKDPQVCTIDEWAGQSVAMLFLPLGASAGQWWLAAGVALAAFRLFDIVKPPPARRMEKLPYGWGVLLDDLVAGLYANLAAQLVLRLGFHLS